MKEIWISKAGSPKVLEVREAAEPTPVEGTVRVKTSFSGINFADLMARMGAYPDAPPIPTVVGYEVSGVIDAVGKGVTRLKAGDRVSALTRFRGYSSSVIVPESHLVVLPSNVSDESGAAFPVNYLTAWLMLDKLGNLQPNQTVLVYSGAGGVGLAALQICIHKSARIIAVASEEKHERLYELGATCCVNYKDRSVATAIRNLTGDDGVNIVLDSRGGSSFRKSYAYLSPLGRLFMFGASGLVPGSKRNLLTMVSGIMSMPRFKPLDLMNDNKGIMGCNLAHLWDEIDTLQQAFQEIIQLGKDDVLSPVIDSIFSFEDAGKAHQHIHNRKNFGKVLLQP